MGEREVGLQQAIQFNIIMYRDRLVIYIAGFCAKQVGDLTSHNTQSVLRLMHFLWRLERLER